MPAQGQSALSEQSLRFPEPFPAGEAHLLLQGEPGDAPTFLQRGRGALSSLGPPEAQGPPALEVRGLFRGFRMLSQVPVAHFVLSVLFCPRSHLSPLRTIPSSSLLSGELENAPRPAPC